MTEPLPDDDDQPEMAPSEPRPDLVTDADLERLVRDFYRAAAVDDVLGPVFAAAGLDWPDHIARVTEFWSWQLLGGRRYDGRPLRSHERVNAEVPFTEAHYERWLELFTATLRDSWSGPIADQAERRARRMARSMRRVLAGDADPDPTWSEEPGAPEPGAVGGEPDQPGRGASGGLVLPVVLGRPARRTPGRAEGGPASPGGGSDDR